MHRLSSLIKKLEKSQTIKLINTKARTLFRGKLLDIPEIYLDWLVLDIKGLFLTRRCLVITIVEELAQ